MKIESCPFCGNRNIRVTNEYLVMFRCEKCGAMVSFDYDKYLDDLELNIAAFNRREREKKENDKIR